jgi:uncharacterized protein involved in type VI secretion and phage assembly
MGAPDFTSLPQNLWHAHYLAEVVDLNDPSAIGRVQVRLLSFDGVAGQDAPLWARIALPFAGTNRGAYFMPDIGDEVLVSFVNGDPRYPVIVGGLWNGQAAPPETMDSASKNYLKVIRSRNGVKVTLDDHDGQEKMVLETPGGQKITLKDGPGAIEIVDANGNSVKLESSGITVQASAKVTVQAASVDVSAGMVKVDAGMSKFSGVVQCDTLIATTVVASTYTPGAGNIW